MTTRPEQLAEVLDLCHTERCWWMELLREEAEAEEKKRREFRVIQAVGTA